MLTKKLVIISEKSNDEKISEQNGYLADAYLMKGDIEYALENYQSARNYYRKAEDIYDIQSNNTVESRKYRELYNKIVDASLRLRKLSHVTRYFVSYQKHFGMEDPKTWELHGKIIGYLLEN